MPEKAFRNLFLGWLFLVGIVACATVESDPDELLTEAQAIYDVEAHKDPGSLEIGKSEITKEVITDYVKIIDFLGKRKDFKDRVQADVPIFPNSKDYPQVTLFYNAQYQIDRQDGSNRLIENCREECAKILYEGHAERVVIARISVDTLEVAPDTVRVFRKGESCQIPPDYRANFGYGLKDIPALGLCTVLVGQDDPLAVLERDGLYVYKKQVSPIWPKSFFIDGSEPLLLDYIWSAVRRATVFTGVDHLRAHIGGRHLSMVEIIQGQKQTPKLLNETIEFHVTPSLPDSIFIHLVESTIGKEYLTDKMGRDGIYVEHGHIELGGYDDDIGLFHEDDTINGRLNYTFLFSNEEIVSKLNSVFARAKAGGANAPEWDALAEALVQLFRHHPDFDEDLVGALEPVLIETIRLVDGMERFMNDRERAFFRAR